MAETRLNFLEDLKDYKVASDDPDVRGWTVVDRNENTIGTVEHLLADVEEKRVRYLDIDPEEDLIGEGAKVYAGSASGAHEYRDREGDVHMIVPVDMTRIDKSKNRIMAERVDKNEFMKSPMLEKGKPVTMEQEREVQKYFDNLGAPAGDVGGSQNRHQQGGQDQQSKVSGTSGTAQASGDTAQGKKGSVQPESKEVSADDGTQKIKTSPENKGVPSTNPDADEVSPSDSSLNKGRSLESSEQPEGRKDKESKNEIQSSGRSMKPEKSNEAKLSGGAPESLEAGATSEGAQAGDIGTRTGSGRENMRDDKMNVEGELDKDREKNETRSQGQTEDSGDGTEHRESDESAARKKQSGNN